MRVRLDLEYSGERFSGWQIQPGLVTIQGELERALLVLVRSVAKRARTEAPSRVEVYGSGRTDAGVHAKHQVATIDWPEALEFNPRRLVAGLNALTPPEVVVHSAAEAPADFHARLSPHAKCYCYRILPREWSSGYYKERVWCVPYRLDIPAMIEAARAFAGKNDYSSFRALDCTAKTTIRTILLSEFSRDDSGVLSFCCVGKGFLKNMIRIAAGTLVDIGRGRLPAGSMRQIIDARDRQRAGQTAPACGLTLEWVRYGTEFAHDD